MFPKKKIVAIFCNRSDIRSSGAAVQWIQIGFSLSLWNSYVHSVHQFINRGRACAYIPECACAVEKRLLTWILTIIEIFVQIGMFEK